MTTPQAVTTPQALDGIIIADFSRVLAGPYATMLLGDLGAEIIKIERPGTGDDTRGWGPPFAAGESTYFLGVNRNKRSVTLDLSTDEGREMARSIIARADVVVENFRPGAMDRLGLGFEHVKQLNPRAIYCSVTGFGSNGGAVLPGYDLLVQAVGGLMSITGEPAGEPAKAGVAVVDVITGLHAAVGILTALHHRHRSGQGQIVEVSLMKSLLSALVNQASSYITAGVVSQRMGNRHPSIAPYEVYQAADRPLVLAVGNDRQFQSLCNVMGRPELAEDERFSTNTARVKNREELNKALAEELAEHAAEWWFTALTTASVPCGPINDIDAAFDLAASLGLDPIIEINDPSNDCPVRQVANPIGLSVTPARYRLSPPALGVDNYELQSRFSTAATCASEV